MEGFGDRPQPMEHPDDLLGQRPQQVAATRPERPTRSAHPRPRSPPRRSARRGRRGTRPAPGAARLPEVRSGGRAGAGPGSRPVRLRGEGGGAGAPGGTDSATERILRLREETAIVYGGARDSLGGPMGAGSPTGDGEPEGRVSAERSPLGGRLRPPRSKRRARLSHHPRRGGHAQDLIPPPRPAVVPVLIRSRLRRRAACLSILAIGSPGTASAREPPWRGRSSRRSGPR